MLGIFPQAHRVNLFQICQWKIQANENKSETNATLCSDKNLGHLLLLMFRSRLKAKVSGSAGPRAKSNCIDARQPELSVNKSLATQTCFLLANMLCFRTL